MQKNNILEIKYKVSVLKCSELVIKKRSTDYDTPGSITRVKQVYVVASRCYQKSNGYWSV